MLLLASALSLGLLLLSLSAVVPLACSAGRVEEGGGGGGGSTGPGSQAGGRAWAGFVGTLLGASWECRWPTHPADDLPNRAYLSPARAVPRSARSRLAAHHPPAPCMITAFPLELEPPGCTPLAPAPPPLALAMQTGRVASPEVPCAVYRQAAELRPGGLLVATCQNTCNTQRRHTQLRATCNSIFAAGAGLRRLQRRLAALRFATGGRRAGC
jgi:hypothetical protein